MASEAVVLQSVALDSLTLVEPVRVRVLFNHDHGAVPVGMLSLAGDERLDLAMIAKGLYDESLYFDPAFEKLPDGTVRLVEVSIMQNVRGPFIRHIEDGPKTEGG